MGHSLQLDVPKEVYESLVRSAKQTGQPPEAVAVQWLISATASLEADPLEAFIGAFPSDIADWGDEHDRYIGSAILDQADAEPGDGQPNG